MIVSWVQELSERDLADHFLLTRKPFVSWSMMKDSEEFVLIFFLPGMMRNLFFSLFVGVLKAAAGRQLQAMRFRTEDDGMISLALISE